MNPPSNSQLFLLGISTLMFVCGLIMSIAKPTEQRRNKFLSSDILLILGTIFGIGVLVWHGITRGNWMPIGDNFDALIWLAMLLAIFGAYLQHRRMLDRLDWFVLPIVIGILVLAIVFGSQSYHLYVDMGWSWLHRVTAFVGAVASSIAAATGIAYLLTSNKLRHKQFDAPRFGSLEKLERLTYQSVTLGFALLTISMVTGGVQMHHDPDKFHIPTSKIALTVVSWIVYAIVLHAPINPRFRGRKTAFLSIAGFVLMISTILTVLFIGGKVN